MPLRFGGDTLTPNTRKFASRSALEMTDVADEACCPNRLSYEPVRTCVFSDRCLFEGEMFDTARPDCPVVGTP